MKILYLSYTDVDLSLNAVYIKGLRQNGVEVLDFFPDNLGFGKYLQIGRYYFQNRKGADFIIVANNCPGLAIWMSVISRKVIIYNALCSVMERLIISRRVASRYSLKYVYYWFLDYFACKFSDLIMVESDHQLEFFRHTFKVPKNKLFLAWTGVDEDKFYYDPVTKKFDKFTVVFRGRLLPEAGGDAVVGAAKKLENEDIDFIMLAAGQELPKMGKSVQLFSRILRLIGLPSNRR